MFYQTGHPRFILDLRNVSGSHLSNWLNRELDFRSIGAMAMEYAFYPTAVADEFDFLIYFEKTTPTILLKKN